MMELFESEGGLYLPQEKVASIELEEDATQWPRQVLTELFRVLPEITDYTPDVRFIRTNEEQGYALGVVVITNSTNSALAAQNTGSVASPRALVPVVVKNGRLCPLDTLMSASGKMWPLTVDRLRQVLYRPESFELVTEDWGDSALSSLFQPPGAAGFGSQGGMGGMGAPGGVQYMMGPGMGGGMKMSMLAAIDGTVLEPDLDKFAALFSGDVALRQTLVGNQQAWPALRKIADMVPITHADAAARERVIEDMYPVDIMRMGFDADLGLYEVKTANRDIGLLRTYHLDRGDFLRFVNNEKLAAQVDTEGPVVAATKGHAVIVMGPNGDQPKLIQRSGHHTVFNAVTGAPLQGYVFTGLIDGRGARVPVALFISSLGAMVQDQIAGTYASGRREALPHDPPRGRGCFIICPDESEHSREATVELEVQGSVSDPGATRYQCVDMTGERIIVTLQRGMQAAIAFPDRKELVIPYGSFFVSTETPVPALVSRAPDTEKTAMALLHGRITVTAAPGYDGYRVSMQHMPKLAAALPTGTYPQEDALYALCIAGLTPDDAIRALTKVANEGRCEVLANDIGRMPMPDIEKIADHVVELRDLHPHLTKEAASLPDAMTVDAILALDFINSENVRTFISMIPHLEKAENKVCELLFASRLGLTEIPETATARAARGIDDTVRGLKSLALRQIDELP